MVQTSQSTNGKDSTDIENRFVVTKGERRQDRDGLGSLELVDANYRMDKQQSPIA